jgi:fucose permease
MARRTPALVSSCLILFGTGVMIAALGPLLPQLAANTRTSLVQVGLLFPFAYLGAIPAAFLIGVAVDRFGGALLLACLAPLFIAVIAGFTLSRSLASLLPLSFAIGVVTSALLTGGIVFVAKVYAERSVPAVNLTNLFFGLGAIAGPALVAWGTAKWDYGMPALWVGGASAMAALPLLLRFQSRERSQRNERVPTQAGPVGTGWSILRSPLLWIFGVVLLLDVGTEQAIGGWVTVYFHQTVAFPLARAALVASGFWVTFTLGRLLATALSVRLPPRLVLYSGALLAVAAIVLVNLGAGSVNLSICGFLLAGLGLGPVYPTTMAFVGNAFSGRGGTAIGAAVATGTCGGMFFPWLEGILIARLGTAAGALLLALTAAGIVVFISLALRRAASGVREAAAS